MKGLETKQILGLVLVIVLLVVISVFIIFPTFDWGVQSAEAITFRRVCLYWSLNKPAFSGTTATDTETGVVYDLSDPDEPWACPKNIGVDYQLDPINDDTWEWEKCRDACTLVTR